MPWPPHRFRGRASVSTLRSHRSAGQVNARLGRVFGTPDARRRRGADPRRGQRGVSDATTLIHAIIAEALRHPVWTEWCRLDEETDERLAQLDLQKWLDPRFREARLEAAAAKPDDPRISPVAADTYGGATR